MRVYVAVIVIFVDVGRFIRVVGVGNIVICVRFAVDYQVYALAGVYHRLALI